MRRGLVVLLLLATATPAIAQPLLGLRPGGTATEGPTDFDPTGVWWNPAAIGPLRGLHVVANGQLGMERGSYDRAASAGVDANHAFPKAALSANHFGYFGAATWDFGFDSFTLGVAVYSPFGDGRSFAESKTQPFSSLNLPAGYHLVAENFQNVYVSFAAALRLHPRLYIGVSVTPIDSSTDLTFYRDGALDGGDATVARPNSLCGGRPCGYENPAAAQRIQVHGDGGSFFDNAVPKPSGLGIGLGLIARPSERVWLGLSWQHVVPLPATSSAYDRPYEQPSATGARVTPSLGQGPVCGGTTDARLPCLGGDSIGYALPDVYHFGARIQLTAKLELTTWVRLVTYGGYGGSNDFALRGLVVGLDGAPVTDAHLPRQIVIAHALRPSVDGDRSPEHRDAATRAIDDLRIPRGTDRPRRRRHPRRSQVRCDPRPRFPARSFGPGNDAVYRRCGPHRLPSDRGLPRDLRSERSRRLRK